MLGGDDRAVLIGSDWGAEAAYGAAAFAPDRWRRVVTIGVPPLALDTRIFADYDQLKKFFYLFFLKTPLAESVLAAADMAFLHRLWQDWSPGYDARENLRDVKQCLGGESHLAAAMGYYRAPEPGLSGFDTDGAYAAQEQALARCGPRNPRSTCTAVVTAVSTSRSSRTLSFTLRPGQEWRWWPTTATSPGREAGGSERPDPGLDQRVSASRPGWPPGLLLSSPSASSSAPAMVAALWAAVRH